jgi:hypothetical protein
MLPLAAVVSKGLLRLSFADQRISGSGRQGPRFRPPGLSPRPLTNSAVISLGGSFVWVPKPWIAHRAARQLWLAPRWGVIVANP